MPDTSNKQDVFTFMDNADDRTLLVHLTKEGPVFPVGLLSFPLTPFDAQDRLDLDVFARHLADQLAQGPAGIFAAAGAGEYSALTEAEYTALVAAAVSQVGGGVPLWVGAGGGTPQAITSVRAAEAAGADGILLLPPYLVLGPAEGLVEHVRRVAAATTLPIAVYQRANARFTEAAALALLDVENVVALKDGLGDVEHLQRVVTAVRGSGHPRAASFGFQNGQPTAELSVPAYTAVGVPGYSSAVLNFAPDIARAFAVAHAGGDAEGVQELLAAFYLPFAAIRDRVPGYAVSLIKAGTVLRGLPVGYPRPPLVPARERDVEDLAVLLRTARQQLAGRLPEVPAPPV